MATSPPAQANKVRVTRTMTVVTETYIDTTVFTTVAAQLAQAKTLAEVNWTRRRINNVQGEDRFEYNVIASDV